VTEKGFLASLFDTSFSSLVTPRIIKVIYIIILVVLGLVAVVALITGIARGGASIIATIIIVPLAFLLYVIFARVYLEIVIVLFKIKDANEELVRLQRGQAPGGAPPTTPMSSPPPPAAPPPPAPAA
jgi:uncharacterized protein DUF4282